MNSVILQISQETENLIIQQITGQVAQQVPANTTPKDETALHTALMLEHQTKVNPTNEVAREEAAKHSAGEQKKTAAKSSDLGSSSR